MALTHSPPCAILERVDRESTRRPHGLGNRKEGLNMVYGTELIKQLEAENERLIKAIDDRQDRVSRGDTDWDDCFISQRCETRGIGNNNDKINLIKNGGCAWFTEYTTLDGTLVKARWCDTRYGLKLRAEMPDGSVVWTSSYTEKGLAKKGLKKVECKRPAWYAFKSSSSGMLGVYTGGYELFPSDYNYATGEPASDEPIEIREWKDNAFPKLD